jgi:hypothetical protein
MKLFGREIGKKTKNKSEKRKIEHQSGNAGA